MQGNCACGWCQNKLCPPTTQFSLGSVFVSVKPSVQKYALKPAELLTPQKKRKKMEFEVLESLITI